MRKVCLAALLAFVWANPASAQNNWANKLFKGGKPTEPIEIDFGVVAKGAQLEKKLEMTNIWKVPLTLDIHVSCGCVEATSSKKTLQPSETAILHIKMDGTLLPGGPKTVNVNVRVGPEFISTAYLLVKANARQDVLLNPGEVNFGSVQRGTQADRSLEVECQGKPAWRVDKVQPSFDAPFTLKPDILPPRINNGVQVIGYRIHVTLKPDAPVGTFRELVDLFTNDQQKVTFVVTGTVLPSVTVQPNPVQPLGLKVGAPLKTTVAVTAAQPFRIVGIQGNTDELKLDMSNRMEKTHLLDLHITPKAAGPLNREIILQTDYRNESIKVVVKGNVLP
jgi:hypothetical protein